MVSGRLLRAGKAVEAGVRVFSFFEGGGGLQGVPGEGSFDFVGSEGSKVRFRELRISAHSSDLGLMGFSPELDRWGRASRFWNFQRLSGVEALGLPA